MNELIIREQVAKLLSNELTFDHFKRWFFAETWHVEHDIIYTILLLLAEYSHGDWTQQEMRKEMKDILEHATIGDKPNMQIETGTSSMTMEVQA